MKALIFAFADLESASRADAIARNLEQSCLETVVCDYALASAFKPSRLLRPTRSSTLTLSDFGFNSIPQLSARQYRNAFGDDIDFPAISGLSFFSDYYPNTFPLEQTFLNTESLYYQRLRGLAARIDHILRAIKPDVIIVQQGSGVISRLITAKALQSGLTWLCWESPFFPGYLLVDPMGQHFLPGQNKIDRDWADVSIREFNQEETELVAGFIKKWMFTKTTKYAQETRPNEAERLLAFLKTGDGPVLFVPMQVPLDANVYHGIGGFSTLKEFYRQVIECLPPGWRAVFKPHPMDCTSQPLLGLPSPRVLVVDEVSIHDLILVADAVAVFSSNVGLEALLYGKPVIVGGKPCYGGKGLTIDVRSGAELPNAIEMALTWRPNLGLRDRLVRYLLDDYLIREDDSAALFRRIEEARAAPLNTDPRCPFSECDPPVTAEYLRVIRRYDNLARRNLMPSEILPLIEIPNFCTRLEIEQSDLMSGERQASAWVTRIEHGHLSRYALVASVIPPSQRVLDLACGVGYGAHILAERNKAQVTAIDGSKESIEYAQSNWAHPGIIYRVASAGTFFNEETEVAYDVIVSFETIEHLRDAELFLEQAWRRLRPGGVLFVSTPNSDVYPLMNHPFHVEHYDVEGLRDSFSRLGDIGDCQIYWQHGNTVSAKSSSSQVSRFLIGAVFKNTNGKSWAVAPESLRSVIPFTYTAPTKEFAGLREAWNMLMRRKGWLRQLITR